MSVTTIYYCDNCKNVIRNPSTTIDVRVTHKDGTGARSYGDLDIMICKECFQSLGFLDPSITDERTPIQEKTPTIAQLIKQIVTIAQETIL